MSIKIAPPGRRGAAPTATVPHRPPLPTIPVLHTAATVARRFDVSLRTVRRLIAAGALPAHRIGRSVRVSEDDLARFLAAHRRLTA